VVVHLLFKDVGRRISEFLAKNQALRFRVGEVTGESVNAEFEPRGSEPPDATDGFARGETALEGVA
jgi:hypothetical protein